MVNILSLPIQTSATYLLTDSRTLTFANESIFFAIKGSRNDGHQFINDLYHCGVRNFVVEKSSCNAVLMQQLNNFENTNVWIVNNSIHALQDFVTAKRHKYNIPIIGITGSNGKTIVKEWLSQLLSYTYSIVKSPKSYNSQIGVPLSVWQINNSHTLGIFEAGISQINEMEYLEKVIKPTVGIFTNIGTSHAEFFKNNEEKIKEKLKLFVNSECIIFCRDDKILENEIIEFSKFYPKIKLNSWSLTDNLASNFKLKNLNNLTQLTFNQNNTSYSFQLNFNDEASVQNICHCIMAMLILDIDVNFIQTKITQIKPVSMRLELKEGINNCIIIDDSYNNDLAGLRLAFDFLNQQNQYKKKVLILSDLLQSGEDESKLYTEIARLVHFNKISSVVAVGPIISKHIEKLPNGSFAFQNTEILIENLTNLNIKNAVVLVKGARKFSFERIVNLLQSKSHDTILEINLDSLTNNLNYFKQTIGAKTKIMAMVKAYAYGAGNLEVARHLQFHGIDYLGVAYSDEGVFLRNNGINLPIMVMNPTEHDFQKLFENALEPEIFSINKLHKLIAFMEGQLGIIKIHIKLDTGMHRLGFEESQLTDTIQILKTNPNLIVASIFSHLAASENADFDQFTHQQAQYFNNMAQTISEAIGYRPSRHILNTSGINRFSQYKMDMVRLGIGLYGVGSTLIEKENLTIIASLKTKISQIKTLKANETIGYGRKGLLKKDSKIATIAIGYADGYNRRFGNGVGKVLINNHLCPTIGNICMDMTMVDITNIEANEGDIVTVFGKEPTVYDLANQIDTIPYEILTNIGERVKRVFYKV